MELYGTDYSDVEISMVGRHQGENLKTALAVIEVLRKSGEIKVERGRLYDGLKTQSSRVVSRYFRKIR